MRLMTPRWLAAVAVTAAVTAATAHTPAPTAHTAHTGRAADDGAHVVAERWLDARTLDLTVDSPAMATTEQVRLLVPPDWNSRPAARWPVLYLLHGCCDSYLSWTRSTDVEALTSGTDVLVVMPEAGATGWYSDWWNGGAGGPPRWETFHLTELRQILERGYHAGTRRAVAGLSMGGFGAMYYAAHSHLFRAAASFSGVLHPLYDPAALAWLYPPALWGDPVAQRDVWAAHDPTGIAGRLRGVSLFVASGDGRPGVLDPPDSGIDSIELQVGAMSHEFVTRLAQLGIPFTADFYGAGHHAWAYWQRELHAAFPRLMHAIGARPVN
jgi:S-formylglutathione hydrolase FrmB